MKCRKTVAYTTNLFIELNMQQRRHVSALFYGAIFRSSMVLNRKFNNPRGGCCTLWVTVDDLLYIHNGDEPSENNLAVRTLTLYHYIVHKAEFFCSKS